MMEDRLVTKWILVASYRVSGDASTIMGAYSSKTTLSGEDMQFLQAKTQLDQASIQVPWHLTHLASWHFLTPYLETLHFLTLLDTWHLTLDTCVCRSGTRGSWLTAPVASWPRTSLWRCTPRSSPAAARTTSATTSSEHSTPTTAAPLTSGEDTPCSLKSVKCPKKYLLDA